MWSDYFFYLMGLPENKRNTQIAMIVAFWIIMFLIGGTIEFIKHKLSKNNVEKNLHK